MASLLNSPKIVYKYRSWDDYKHKRILKDNEIYFSSAQDFNDPYDCRIPQNFSLLSKEEIYQYISDLAVSQYSSIEKRGIDLKQIIYNLEKRFSDIENIQKERDKLEFEDFDKYYGILSLSCRWNSVLLWSHYANRHEGFCIGFHEEKLRNFLLPNAVGAGRVNYSKNFPELKPRVIMNPDDKEIIKMRFTKTYAKSLDWSHEKEYRIFINYFPKVPDTCDRIIHFSDDIISEVIIGMKMQPDFREEIISICKEKNITVFQAQKDDFKFEIKKARIK
jgi:hypothetical protein